eukprot:COSAG01_NODE_24532_length_775_cov_17.868343_1_plen_163_part_01
MRAVLLPPTAAGEETASGGPLVDEATLPLLHGAMVREAERREKQAARAQVGAVPAPGAIWGCFGGCHWCAVPRQLRARRPNPRLKTLSGSHGGADIIYHDQSKSRNASKRRRISAAALVLIVECAQARTAERYLALLKDYSKQKDITVESSWDAETIELLSAH